ncbi:DUF6692 family protein [Altericroceibacterium xinjiangense]|uniref:DUF6692 family protein n=1 Tax=Altericroceibacterium xinjiangense TaxID=762261 RepID=UPI000F7DBC2A|nr:DUF6692 family protein [Altericroceibacterium xinjiangense]
MVPLSACNSNTAPGNDEESQFGAAPTPAPVVSADEALDGIAVEVVQPEIMTNADLVVLGGLEGKCDVRLTKIAYPSFVFERAGQQGWIKLNQKLIPLARAGENLFVAGDLQVTIRGVDEPLEIDEQREAEMILLLPEAKDELGFRGYGQCYEAE